MCSQAVLPVLLDVLPTDSFWIIRCSIIQALERIGDPAAIPTLREVAKHDRFSVVRSHAAKAIGILAEQEKHQYNETICFTGLSDLDRRDVVVAQIVGTQRKKSTHTSRLFKRLIFVLNRSDEERFCLFYLSRQVPS